MTDNRGQTKPAPNSEERSLTGIGGLRPQPPAQEGTNSGQNNQSSDSAQGNSQS